jgi:anti-sigma factor RsiW
MNDHPTLPPDDLACTDEVELITDYLEGALPDSEAERLERHIAICPGCTEFVEQMRTLAESLGGLREEQLSPETRAGLIENFREFRK